MAAADRAEVMADVRRLILATDMSRHGEYMRELRALLEPPAGSGAAEEQERRRRQLTAELLIKCADTSNVVKPFPVARHWAVRTRCSSAALPAPDFSQSHACTHLSRFGLDNAVSLR